MAMTYTKPKGVRYVDMCIYIDNVMKNWDPETNPLTQEQEENIYKYIYHFYYNTACRKHYFSKFEDYDAYALWCATKAFLRLLDTNQQKVKSIRNYMEATAYGWKIKWQVETFQTILSEEHTHGFDSSSFKEEYQKNIRNSHREKLIEEIKDDLKLIPVYLKDIINESPYKNDRVLCKHLYVSVLLSWYREIEQLEECRNLSKYSHRYTNNIKLWRLDPKMVNVVNMMLTKLQSKLMEEINYSLHKFDLDSSDAEILMSFKNTMPEANPYYDRVIDNE